MKNRSPWALALMLVLPAISPAEDSPSRHPSIEIGELIEKVARRTGKQFIVDPRVRAEIPLIGLDVGSIDYARMLAILNVHQFVAFEAGGVVRVIPDASMRQLPIPVSSEVPAKALDDEVVTLVVQVKNACSAYLVPIVRPLMPQAAHLAALPSNALIVVDRAANARRIADMIERLDKGATPNTRCGPEILGARPEGKSESK